MKARLSLLACLALVSTTLAGQSQAPQTSAPPAGRGAAAGLPWWTPSVEGQPIDTRPTEKKDNAPAFPEQTRAPYHATAPFKVTTLVDNLHAPWSMAFLPDGKILVTERLPGTMRIVDPKGEISEPLTGVNVVMNPEAKDIGLLDLALDPNFATTGPTPPPSTSSGRWVTSSLSPRLRSKTIYRARNPCASASRSRTAASLRSTIRGKSCSRSDRVARARLDEAKGALTDVTVIFRGQPAIPSKRLGGKTGGRIAIARDGSLFLPLGDRSDSPPWDVAQRMDTHLGKIVHITQDGAPAPDNPFIGKPGVLPEIWAVGTRGQEGLTFDPRTADEKIESVTYLSYGSDLFAELLAALPKAETIPDTQARLVRIAVQHAVIVFAENDFYRRLFLSSHDFFPSNKRQPGIAAPVLAFATVFDPGIDAVHESICNAPGQVGGASDRHADQPRKGRAHRITRPLGRGPTKDRLIPNRRQPVNLQMRIVAEKRFARSGL